MHAALTEEGWHVNILEDTAHKTHTHKLIRIQPLCAGELDLKVY